MIRDSRVVVGGGACELNCSTYLAHKADEIAGIEQYAIRGFAEALKVIPLALAENSGLSPIETVSDARAKQVNEDTQDRKSVV